MGRQVTIRQALQRVVDNPEIKTTMLLDLPVHELVSRTLFEIANSADINQRGSLTRSHKARDMIFNRLVGKRRAGSHPSQRKDMQVTFITLGPTDE